MPSKIIILNGLFFVSELLTYFLRKIRYAKQTALRSNDDGLHDECVLFNLCLDDANIVLGRSIRDPRVYGEGVGKIHVILFGNSDLT